MKLLDQPDCRLYACDHATLLGDADRFQRDTTKDGAVAYWACDMLCVDAPYSAKCHTGHDQGAKQSEGWGERNGDSPEAMYAKKKGGTKRKPLDYTSWDESDVSVFVGLWSPATRGWFVTITDHVLAPVWAAALEAAGRYVFQPLPFVDPGSRVRLLGDGPSSWSCWIIVARPKNVEFSKWGTLRGAYVVPPGQGERRRPDRVTGGKPRWLMEALVRDYSRRGDVVCDPCCGGGTTLLAALANGRKALGGDMDEEHAAITQKALGRELQRSLVGVE